MAADPDDPPATCPACGVPILPNARYCGAHRALGKAPSHGKLLDVPAPPARCPECKKRPALENGLCAVCDGPSRRPSAWGTGGARAPGSTHAPVGPWAKQVRR